MKPRLTDLVRWTGTLDRGAYLFWGVVLGILKYNLDRWAVHRRGNGTWDPWSYWIPGDDFGLLSAAPERKKAAGYLLLVALPRRMRMEILRSTLPGRHWLGLMEATYDLRTQGGRTILRRTTTYTSLLEPRWYWGGLERIGTSTMHHFVLDDLRARFNKSVPVPAP
jgi:hypothetical protein